IKIHGYPTRGRMTNVYVKRSGRWYCVASHASGLTGEVHAGPAVGRAAGGAGVPGGAGDPAGGPAPPGRSLDKCVSCHAVIHRGTPVLPTGAASPGTTPTPATQPAEPASFLKGRMAGETQTQRYIEMMGGRGAPRADRVTSIRPRFRCLVEKVHVKV